MWGEHRDITDNVYFINTNKDLYFSEWAMGVNTFHNYLSGILTELINADIIPYEKPQEDYIISDITVFEINDLEHMDKFEILATVHQPDKYEDYDNEYSDQLIYVPRDFFNNLDKYIAKLDNEKEDNKKETELDQLRYEHGKLQRDLERFEEQRKLFESKYGNIDLDSIEFE